MKPKTYVFLCLLLFISLAVSCSNETQRVTEYTMYSDENSNESNNIREASSEKSDTESSVVPDKSRDVSSFIDALKVFYNRYSTDVYNEVEKITLEVSEPVTEIQGKADIFPIWGETIKLDTNMMIVIEDGETRKWGVGDAGTIHGMVIQQENDKVYVCSGSNGLPDYVKTDITGLVKQTGINTLAINVKILNDFGAEALLVKISDGESECLFFARLDREEKNHRILLLNQYNIIAAEFLYSVDNLTYIMDGDERFYILYRSEADGKLYQYEMPGDIRRIEDIRFMGGKRYCLYIKAYKEGQENLSFYRVDFDKKCITEYLTLKGLKEQYPLEWSFNSDVASSRYVDQAFEVVLISGTDTRISGFHDHDYLYALNKYTGEKIWEFYGGYPGTPYCFSEDKKYIFLGHRVEGYIKCLETNTGKMVWKKEVGENFEFAAVRDTIVVSNDNTIRAYRGDDGELLWRKTTDKDKYLFSSDNNLSVAVVADSKSVTAYEPVSWKVLWRITGKDCEKYRISLDANILTVPFADTVKIVDIRTGKSINTGSSSYKAVHEVLSGSDVSSGIKILHSIDEEKIRCIDDKDKILWEMDYTVVTPNEPIRYYWYPCPVRIKDLLYVYLEETMVVLDAYTGKVLHQIYDYSVLSSNPVRFEDKTLWMLDNMNGQLEALRIN